MSIAVIAYVIICFIIRQRFSLVYGIPAIPLIWGRVILNTKPEERQARRVFKALGIILIILFVGSIRILGTIMELAHMDRCPTKPESITFHTARARRETRLTEDLSSKNEAMAKF
mgnify:CR=1 FL=1